MAAPALPPGHAIQEYRIQKLLGVGGSGLTYLARDENLGLKVALKECLPADLAQRAPDKSVAPRTGHGLESFATAKRRFLDRSGSLVRLRHPHLARAIRCFEANGSAYLVVELIEGEELTEWVIPRRPLGEAQVAAVASPLLDALEALHDADLPHGDIKAASIRVRRDGGPALLDFAAAPEAEQSAAADLYALAALFYWMTTGIRALGASSRGADSMLTPALQSADGERFGSGFLTAIDWALAPEEGKRPASVREWRAALLGAAASESKTAGGPAAQSAALDAALLTAMQAQLAQHLGPIAALVVRKAAQNASTAGELLQALAREITDPQARLEFEARFASFARTHSAGRARPDPAPAQPAASRFPPEVLARAEEHLAEHIGPTARIVVARVAAQARDRAELYLLLAEEIDDKDKKKEFIRKAVAAAGKPD